MNNTQESFVSGFFKLESAGGIILMFAAALALVFANTRLEAYTSGGGIAASTDPDLALFQDLQAHFHWAAEDYAFNPNSAWRFNFANGSQTLSNKSSMFNILPVLTGDIADITTIPLPASIWLFSSGLVALAGYARRKARA